jgi:hypothetical protein
MKKKIRKINVEKLIDWAQKLLNCPIETLFKLAQTDEPEILNKILITKLGWLKDYQEEIFIWGQMVLMTRTLEAQLKQNGINQESMTEFKLNEFSLFSNQTLVFQQNIIEYITTEIDKIPEGRTILATSDIIESIFGKYKHFSALALLLW